MMASLVSQKLCADSTSAQSSASSSPRRGPEVNSRKNIGRYPALSASRRKRPILGHRGGFRGLRLLRRGDGCLELFLMGPKQVHHNPENGNPAIPYATGIAGRCEP